MSLDEEQTDGMTDRRTEGVEKMSPILLDVVLYRGRWLKKKGKKG